MEGAARGFQSFMDGDGPWWVVLGLLLITPFIALVHELGHALVGLASTDGLVDLQVGRKPAQWQGRVGRLRLSINLLPARNAPAGLAKVYALHSRPKKAAFILAGPFAHMAAGAALLAVGLHAHITVITAIGVIVVITGFANLLPFEPHGHPTDGARLVELFRASHTKRLRGYDGAGVDSWLRTLQRTQARWLALFTDKHVLRDRRETAAILQAAPVFAGLAPQDNGQRAVALGRLAFAGWCWREAERGDLTAILHDLQAAWEYGVRTEETEFFAIAGGAKAAVERVELGLGSPGASDAERKAFLAGAFGRLPPTLRPSDLTHEQQWFAFRFGVALHDIEAVAASTMRPQRHQL